MEHYSQRFHVSPIAVIAGGAMAYGTVAMLLFGTFGGLRWWRHSGLVFGFGACAGMLVVTWLWSVRAALRSVRVDDGGLWVDGDRVVKPNHIRAVGVLLPSSGGLAAFEWVPPRRGAGLLERVGAYFSPDGWVRRHPLPDGDVVAIPGAQDIGGRSASVRVVIVLDGYVEHGVRQGWAVATWRPEELLAAVERIAPDADRLGSAARPGEAPG